MMCRRTLLLALVCGVAALLATVGAAEAALQETPYFESKVASGALPPAWRKIIAAACCATRRGRKSSDCNSFPVPRAGRGRRRRTG